MKNIIKIATTLFMMTGFFAVGQEHQSAEGVLADKTQRKEVMQTIANNHEMMMEMRDVIMSSEEGKYMMGNQQMMQNMMKENPDRMQGMMQNMMQMCQNDSSQCDQMMEMMSGNQMMMQSMMDMMHKKGMMSNECYKNGMNMMEKGKMGNGMMKDKGMMEDDDHDHD